MPRQQIQATEDHISSVGAADIFDQRIRNEDTRQHIKAIISEYADSVPFMEKVQRYATDEIDKRIFKSAKVWASTAIGMIGSALIGAIASHFIR